MIHEEAFIKCFVQADQQDRLLALLASPKNRLKLVHLLAHNIRLDSRRAAKVPRDQHAASTIEKILLSKGAPPTRYVFSENSEVDQKEMRLADALGAVVGRGMGTVISCIPGKLGYFEYEDAGERYILSAAP
jgi:hypothetical protein